jgi:hypothetical protein
MVAIEAVVVVAMTVSKVNTSLTAQSGANVDEEVCRRRRRYDGRQDACEYSVRLSKQERVGWIGKGGGGGGYWARL